VNDQADSQLLRAYAERRSEPAFTELVRRHVDFVYSAALRMVCDSHLAEDVTQAVFVALAKNATQLTDRPVLSGWLHRTAQNIAAQTVRTDVRRRRREQEAAAMNQLLSAEPDAAWRNIAPHLDAALGELSEPDRDALLLRYFERKSAREMAQTLGTSEEAVQKRVSRAVDRLREVFAKRGVTVGASGLVVVISANAVQVAPVGLAVTISTGAAALAGDALSSSTAIAITKTIAMTTIQKALITATIAAAVGTGIYEAHQNSGLREQQQMHQQQQDSLASQNRQLQKERDEAASKLAAARLAAGQPSSNTAELLRLRAEVGRLRNSARELAQLKAATGNDPAIEATLKSWAARASQLKQRLEQMPDKRIPELQLLTDKDWFDAIKNAKQLETDADFRQALNNLRNSAKQAFGNMTREALKKYAEANNGLLPADLSQLKPYFETPVEDSILQRYSLLQTGKLADVPQSEYLFAEKAPPVDDEYDSLYEFQMRGTRSSSVSDPGDIVWQGLIQFAKAHNGLLPADASQLALYLKRPLDQAKVRDILSSIPPGVTTMEQLKAAGPK